MPLSANSASYMPYARHLGQVLQFAQAVTMPHLAHSCSVCTVSARQAAQCSRSSASCSALPGGSSYSPVAAKCRYARAMIFPQASLRRLSDAAARVAPCRVEPRSAAGFQPTIRTEHRTWRPTFSVVLPVAALADELLLAGEKAQTQVG